MSCKDVSGTDYVFDMIKDQPNSDPSKEPDVV